MVATCSNEIFGVWKTGLIQSNFGPWSSLILEPPIFSFFPHFHQTKCLGVRPTAVSISGFWIVNHSGHRMVGTKSKLRPVEKWSRLGCWSMLGAVLEVPIFVLESCNCPLFGSAAGLGANWCSWKMWNAANIIAFRCEAINLPGVRRAQELGTALRLKIFLFGEANVIPDIRYHRSLRCFAHVLQCLYFRKYFYVQKCAPPSRRRDLSFCARPLFAVVQKKGSVSDEDKAYGDAWKVGWVSQVLEILICNWKSVVPFLEARCIIMLSVLIKLYMDFDFDVCFFTSILS